MKTHTQLIALIVLVSTLSGCAKIRELTRRDYAMLKDPFLDRSADAQDRPEEAPSNQLSPMDTSGVVQVAELAAEPSSPNKVSTASQSTPAGGANGSFNGIRVRGMGDAIATDVGAQTANPRGTDAVRTAAAGNKSETDMAALADFVKGQAVASGMTETANELDEDLSEWITAKNNEWKQQSQEVKEGAAPLINPIQKVSQSSDDMEHPQMPLLPKLGYGNAAPTTPSDSDEFATPLIQSSAAAAAAASWVVPTPTVAAEQQQPTPNPFATLASESGTKPIDSQPPVIQPQGNPVSTASKPSNNVQRPDPFAQPVVRAPSLSTDAPPKPVFDESKVEEEWNPFSGFETPKPVSPNSAAEKSPFETRLPKEQSPVAPLPKSRLDSAPGFSFDSGWRASDPVTP